MKKLVISLVVVSTLAFGAQGDHNSELTLSVGGAVPSSELELNDYLNLGLRYGTYLDNSYIDIVEFGYERGVDGKYKNSTQKTDVNRLFVNAVKEYDINRDFALYGLAGIGYQDFTTELGANKDDGFVHIGVGAKWWVTDGFALKAEIREEFDFHSDRNFIYSLGFTIPFGSKAKKEMPIKSEPVVVQEEAKPIVKEEPQPQPVVVQEAPKDDDKDGVINDIDECLNTPLNKVVNEVGCRKVIRLHIEFDFDKADIIDDYLSQIAEVVTLMKINEDYTVILEGHTDSKGSQDYNLALSQKRADAVAQVLEKQGINSSRISVEAYGEIKPIGSNDTKEGRARNRRVDTHFNK
jgi:OOP family OmpA-OmpF porin